MDKLSIYKIGVKGGLGKNETTGFVAVYSGNTKLLSVDNFSGSGETYKQRENPIISISDGEYCIFEGTHEQLIERLKITK